MFTNVLVSAITGFAGGVAAWAIGLFVEKPVARFYELRREADALMFINANITDNDIERAKRAQADLRRTAAEIDALRSTLPRLVLRALALRGYDLVRARGGLTGLSNSLFASDGSKAFYRVDARGGLRLPIDPTDQATHDRRYRVENAKL